MAESSFKDEQFIYYSAACIKYHLSYLICDCFLYSSTAAKTTLNMFQHSKETTPREKDLFKGVKVCIPTTDGAHPMFTSRVKECVNVYIISWMYLWIG